MASYSLCGVFGRGFPFSCLVSMVSELGLDRSDTTVLGGFGFSLLCCEGAGSGIFGSQTALKMQLGTAFEGVLARPMLIEVYSLGNFVPRCKTCPDAVMGGLFPDSILVRCRPDGFPHPFRLLFEDDGRMVDFHPVLIVIWPIDVFKFYVEKYPLGSIYVENRSGKMDSFLVAINYAGDFHRQVLDMLLKVFEELLHRAIWTLKRRSSLVVVFARWMLDENTKTSAAYMEVVGYDCPCLRTVLVMELSGPSKGTSRACMSCGFGCNVFLTSDKLRSLKCCGLEALLELILECSAYEFIDVGCKDGNILFDSNNLELTEEEDSVPKEGNAFCI